MSIGFLMSVQAGCAAAVASMRRKRPAAKHREHRGDLKNRLEKTLLLAADGRLPYLKK